MNDHLPVGVYVLAAALVIGLFSYYLQLTYQLSFNGGPDEEPHYHAAKFIAQTGRLAVYPDDEADLYFSQHGTTRSFRPPLSYLTGVAASKVLSSIGGKERVQFRSGSALMAALAVLFVFLAARVLFDTTWLALFTALSIGLLPQFTFLASYFNDDTGAIMVVALLTYALTLLMVRGVSLRRLTFVGIAVGLVVLAKPSAWVVSSILALCVSILILRSQIKSWRGLGMAALTAVAVGGWWIAFNIYHHGLYPVSESWT